MAKRGYRLTVQGDLTDKLESASPRTTRTLPDRNTAPAGNLREQAELHGVLRSGVALANAAGQARDRRG
jgi:hypothetical protein